MMGFVASSRDDKLYVCTRPDCPLQAVSSTKHVLRVSFCAGVVCSRIFAYFYPVWPPSSRLHAIAVLSRSCSTGRLTLSSLRLLSSPNQHRLCYTRVPRLVFLALKHTIHQILHSQGQPLNFLFNWSKWNSNTPKFAQLNPQHLAL